MKLTTKVAATAACLAVGAAPAAAIAHTPNDPGAQGKDRSATQHTTTTRGHSLRCRKPTVAKAFVAWGTFTSWTGVKDDPADANSTYSGTITLTVKRTNHHAKGVTSPVTFSKARVRFDSPTATAPAAGDNVRLIGKIVVAKRHCSAQAASATQAPGTITVRKITFSKPHVRKAPATTAPDTARS